ncbi:MAG: hypothetical protein HDR90_00585 [Bacteroides sp.]|nr:hypothetical protein [Bacteroides sp.]MBD5343470.1 hypothetical protein [Bacteroides sp.]
MKEAFDITQYFEQILQQAGSIDIAEAEFKRAIADDRELHTLYREWCRDNGSTERRGFLDYCEEYLDSQNGLLDTLTDYDDEA